MGFQVSPGVTVKEIDLTTIVPNVATTVGATVGAFQWGPVDERNQISTENELVEKYGKPNDDVYEDFYSVANYLAYTNNIQLVRVTGALAKNSVVGGMTQGANAVQGAITDVAVTATTLTLTGTTWAAALKAGDRLILANSEDSANDRAVTIASVDSTTVVTLVSTAGLTANAEDTTMTITYDSVLAGGTAPIVKNETNWSGQTFTTQLFIGKYPGIKGNSISVYTCDAGNYARWKYKNEFDRIPGTSTYATNNGGSNDEMHVIVIDDDGVWTGTPGQVLEKFAFVSKASDAKKIDGSSNYVKTVLERESKYVWMGLETLYASDVNDLATSTFTSQTPDTFGDGVGNLTITTAGTGYAVNDVITATGGGGTGFTGKVTTVGGSGEITGVQIDTQGTLFTTEPTMAVTTSGGSSAVITANLSSLGKGGKLAGGVDDNTTGITAGIRQTGWSLFSNAEEVDVNLLIAGPSSVVTGTWIKDNVADTRKDCVLFVSPAKASVVNNAGNELDDAVADSNSYGSSSYVVMDSAWKYQMDRYNDVFRWIPLNADIAGLAARTDYTNDPWFSPAGYNRGGIKNIVKLSWSPTAANRDTLYTNNINPIVNFPGQGIIMYGDKTMLKKPSAFDRINVRRLFIVLEKAIAIASKFQLFEFNDEFTRSQFKAMVEPFLRNVQGRRGITDYKVVADTSNNTGDVIDRNEFIADIYIKPSRSINFITLNFIATRTDVSFEEIGG